MNSEEKQRLNDNVMVHGLMNGPLVTWISTFYEESSESQTKLNFSQLTDGILLFNVLSKIDPRSSGKSVIEPVDDVLTRIRNLDNFVKAIKHFYEDVLGQLILVRLPDPVILGRDPPSEISSAHLETLLLLLLGCAVQGPRKEDVIEGIKKLPLETQHAIVECIQQVADNPMYVWNKDWCNWEPNDFPLSCIAPMESIDQMNQIRQEEIFKVIIQHLKRIVQERDAYAQQLTTLYINDMAPTSSYPSALAWSITSTNSERQNNGNAHNSSNLVELAECKAKLRRCRQELEEKCEQVAELRDELDATRAISTKVKQENMDLVQEARLSKALRDELDIVCERASKVDKLEAELNRYKDKLNDIDYYKARLEELREDNRLLEETKVILENQLDTARQRADIVLDLENDLLNYKSQINNLLIEKEADKERLKKLAEENAYLQLCTKNCLSESAGLTAEIESLRAHQAFLDNKDQFANISEQLNSKDLMLRFRRLEQENQRLSGLLQNSKTLNRNENSERILHLEADNTKLRLRLTDLEEDRKVQENQLATIVSSVNARANEIDRQNEELRRAHDEHLNVIEALKLERNKLEELELQTATLGTENQKLQRNLDSLERRLESVQGEAQTLESENFKLRSTVDGLRHSLRRLNDLERENTDFETENHRIDRENKGLAREILRLKQSIEVKDASLDQYCSKVTTLERECARLQNETETLQLQAAKLREYERENKELQQTAVVEHKTLIAIREELVQEKIRCQQLQCQLDAKARTLDDTLTECRNVKNALDRMKDKCVCLVVRPNDTSTSDGVTNKHAQEFCDTLPPTLELGREVLAIKDRLVELERQNAVLLAEKDTFKLQIDLHKEHLQESTSQVSLLSQQLATLQVENSTLLSQLSSMNSQNAELTSSLEIVNTQRENLMSELNSYEKRLERLTSDQEELQKLHEQLQIDYESLLSERESLKNVQRECKVELKLAQDQVTEYFEAEKQWNEKKLELENELEKSKAENRTLINLRAEHSRLKDDFRSLFVANEKLKAEYKNIQGDYKSLRMDHNALKLKHTQLQGEAAEFRHEVTNMDVELGKMNNQFEAMQMFNNTLLQDKRNLINQVSLLLAQYHELLRETFDEKGNLIDETKQISDKLNHLKQQKEILEDWIDEETRKMESTLNKSFEADNSYCIPPSARANYGNILNRKLRKTPPSSSTHATCVMSRDQSDSKTSIHAEEKTESVGVVSEPLFGHSDAHEEYHIENEMATQSLSLGNISPDTSAADNARTAEVSCDSPAKCPDLSSSECGKLLEERKNVESLHNSSYLIYDEAILPFTEIMQSTLALRGTATIDTAFTALNTEAHQNSNTNALRDLSSSSVAERSDIRREGKSLNGITSIASSMIMAPSLNLPKLQQLPRMMENFAHNTGGNLIRDSSSLLNKPQQPSRSLALLERAGSRQPLCLTDTDPEIGLPQVNLRPADALPHLNPATALDPYLPSVILNNDDNVRLRSDLVQKSGTIADPSLNAIGHSNNCKQIIPNVTSTTRINVSISSPSPSHLAAYPKSPKIGVAGAEQRTSPKPVYSPFISTGIENNDPPLLPIRTSRTEKPALPPRPSSSNFSASVDEPNTRRDAPAQRVTPVDDGISSVWYEYGCV